MIRETLARAVHWKARQTVPPEPPTVEAVKRHMRDPVCANLAQWSALFPWRLTADLAVRYGVAPNQHAYRQAMQQMAGIITPDQYGCSTTEVEALQTAVAEEAQTGRAFRASLIRHMVTWGNQAQTDPNLQGYEHCIRDWGEVYRLAGNLDRAATYVVDHAPCRGGNTYNHAAAFMAEALGGPMRRNWDAVFYPTLDKH